MAEIGAPMATKLEKTIKRELELGDKVYTVAIGPEGLKITPKGGRKGAEFSWPQLVRELEGGSNDSGMSGGFGG
jgi:hypothetical protein